MVETDMDLEWKTPIPEALRLKYAGEARSGINIVDRHNLAIVQLFAKKGKISAVERKLKIKSKPGMATQSEAFTALPLSPGQWMLIAQGGADGTFCADLAGKVQGIGYCSEQSHGRVCFRVSGDRGADLMERACRLDLDTAIIKPGYCAQTQMAQMGVLLHMVDDQPTFDLYVLSGFAQDFAHWIIHLGLKYGVSFSAGK